MRAWSRRSTGCGPDGPGDARSARYAPRYHSSELAAHCRVSPFTEPRGDVIASHTEVCVVSPHELHPDDLMRWRSLQEGAVSPYANPFLSPAYALAVGRARPTARVAVLRTDGVACGFFGFERGAFGRGVPLGAGLSDHQDVVLHPGVSWDPDELLNGCGVHSMLIENIPRARLPRSARHIVAYPSPVIDLEEGYAGYVAERRRSSRRLVQSVERKRRKLEREVGSIRFEFMSDRRSVLRTVMRWKSMQYATLGEWDRFADGRTVALLDDLLTTSDAGCAGTLSVLYAGDVVAAAHFGLRSTRVLCSWFPTYNPDLARYSPGILLHFFIAEAAAAQGITRFDLGRGEHAYKNALHNGTLELARARLYRPSVRGVFHLLASTPRHRIRPLVKRYPGLESALVRSARRSASLLHATSSARRSPTGARS